MLNIVGIKNQDPLGTNSESCLIELWHPRFAKNQDPLGTNLEDCSFKQICLFILLKAYNYV